MYSPGVADIGDFGRILLSSDKLLTGNQYVFTFESGSIFQFTSTGDIKTRLSYFMQNYSDILRVDRALFSGRYTVVIAMKIETTLSQVLSAFNYSWINMGFKDVTFISAEEGTISTQPGGIPQLFTGAGETFAQMLKPMAPYLIGAVALMVLLPPLVSGLQTAVSRRR